MSQDPYCYPGTDTLINNFNIRDRDKLAERELNVTMRALKGLEKTPVNGNFDAKHLLEVHRRIFGEVYPWAGHPRIINMSKPEPALGGHSVRYGDHKVLSQLLDRDTQQLGKFRWDDNNRPQSAAQFAKLIGNVWQAHAFREGNTRTIGVFMHQFAKERGFELDRETMWPSASETRDFFAKVTVGDGKDLAKRILEARQIGRERDHPELGRVTSMTAQMLRLMGKPEISFPKQGDAVKGQVLSVSYNTALVANARGVQALEIKNFGKAPQANERVNITVQHALTPKSRHDRSAEPEQRSRDDAPPRTVKLAPPRSNDRDRSR